MRAITAVLVAAVLSTAPAFADRYKVSSVNAETPEGKQLQMIMSENDAAKKLAMEEQFATEFPKAEGYGWVLTEMQKNYSAAGDHDKVIQAGEKLLALDRDDLDAAYANLKAAEAKKDPDQVLKWSETTSAVARRNAAIPKKDGDDAEEYKQEVEHAKQVDTYTEYALYSTAIQSSDGPKVLALIETLMRRNPQTQYGPAMLERYTVVARQNNSMEKAVALGEAAAAANVYNEDMLLAMSDYYMNHKQNDKVLTYSTKLVDLMQSKPKPEGVSDANWDKKKSTMMGLGYWMAGMTEAGQMKYAAADKSLRAALPMVKDNPQILSYALFNLGLANYKMAQASKNKAQIADAIRFTEQAAGTKGPMQAQAVKNVAVMRKEFGVAAK
jgi:tetratricopeptide (TPR) repeat protein